MDKKKVLVVEDDFFIRDLYETEAKARGYDVISAADGEEAIVKVKSLNPDFILLDLMLPKVDGLSVLKTVKSDPKTANVPVVIITNLEDPAKEKEAMAAGASEYLLKIKNTPSQVIDEIKKYLS